MRRSTGGGAGGDGVRRRRRPRIWDALTALAHAGAVNYARGPDGAHLVTASGDRTARLWDAGTGQPIGAPPASRGRARFSPEGGRVVTASSTAPVWDARTGEPLTEPFRHAGGGVVGGLQCRGRPVCRGVGGRDGGDVGGAPGRGDGTGQHKVPHNVLRSTRSGRASRILATGPASAIILRRPACRSTIAPWRIMPNCPPSSVPTSDGSSPRPSTEPCCSGTRGARLGVAAQSGGTPGPGLREVRPGRRTDRDGFGRWTAQVWDVATGTGSAPSWQQAEVFVVRAGRTRGRRLRPACSWHRWTFRNRSRIPAK